MTLIPVTNARLTKIAAPGGSEDYDTPAGDGPSRWTGDEGVYLANEVLTDTSRGELDELGRTVLTLRSALSTVKIGDSVTVTYDGAPQTRTVRRVRRFDAVGLTKLHLEDD